MAGEKFPGVEYPQLLRRVRVPQTRQKPDDDANLDYSKADVVPIPRMNGNLLLPEIAKRFTRQKPDNHNQHRRLTQQPNPRLVDLRRIHVDVLAAAWRSDAEVVHEPAANLKEDFYAVNQEEHDDDEQKNGIAAVENAVQRVFIAEELRWQNLQVVLIKSAGCLH